MAMHEADRAEFSFVHFTDTHIMVGERAADVGGRSFGAMWEVLRALSSE